ncbi:hypothetical protein SDRG_08106 [Saprolegnia diclina VS20]|uniref:Uncharacterized protein n=1 Tax=Saprolegnia diclina (strain VS20) TaxID=1156394 RepID=T0Q8W2_SAPDV|nr:hypothetical protein SDRG_08106 [Saprolegnia diclina VS20]EQC34334.1 hypothetical protein SDRG_08106 [Saprolegnia diclina VS20]|eukprot:XP_008612196.1 hypothetical protein SDRG_08106 [Saprolegnia diclina VS20]
MATTSVVVPRLYRALLRLAKTFHANEIADKSIYAGVRSGGLLPYDGVQEDWKREQGFRLHLDVLSPTDVQAMAWKDVVAAIHLKFATPSRLADAERIDRGFSTLRALGDHNALIELCVSNGAFTPKRRMPTMRFKVGDVVDVQGLGRGVICNWYYPTLKYMDKKTIKIKYTVLLHTDRTNEEDRWKMYRVTQERLHMAEIPEPISNPSLLFYFDGFEHGRHVPSHALALRFPDDVDAHPAPVLPTIMQLQSADESLLTQYLRSADTTIVRFTKVALESIWLNEAGEVAKAALDDAMAVYEGGAVDQGKAILHDLVETYPDWAPALEKLAMATLADEHFAEAQKLFQRVLDLKPCHFRALSGLATCAVRQRDWTLAHDTAAKLIRLEPDSVIARKVLTKVDEALYHLL